MSRFRLKILFISFLIVWSIIALRLITLQLFQDPSIERRAQSQHQEKEIISAERGLIYDSNQEKLAFNDLSFEIHLEMAKFKSMPQERRLQMLRDFAKQTAKDQKFYQDKVDYGVRNSKHTIVFCPAISDQAYNEIRIKKYEGIVEYKTLTRNYSNLASSLIGNVNVDFKGSSGLEKQYNEILAGRNGYQIVQLDALGNRFSRTDYDKQNALHGKHLQLTINRFHQSILEDELLLALNEYQAKDVTGVIMDPFSGEILGMASFSRNKNENYNRAVIDLFEPGSTFKIFTAAASLELGLKKPKDLIFCENGSYRVGPKVYRDDKHKFAFLSFQDVIAKSSNIGSIKVGMQVGASRLYRFIRDFGFGNVSGIQLDGESPGLLKKPDDWSQTSLPSISFGHEIGVTAIQMVQAYSVIANGGYLIQPRLIKQILNNDLSAFESSEKEVVRQVISGKTAETLKSFLESVVLSGTGLKAQNKDFKIGGKTGTAQVYDPIQKSWTSGKVVASFIGMFPIEEPKYVMAIIVNEPRYKQLNYGGYTAAPTFASIAKKLYGYFDQSLELSLEEMQEDSNSLFIPDFMGLKFDDVKLKLDEKRWNYKVEGVGQFVVKQEPKSGIYSQDKFQLLQLELSDEEAMLMPNLTKLTLREALRKVARFKFKIKIEGQGLVYRQSLSAGTKIVDNKELVIYCK